MQHFTPTAQTEPEPLFRGLTRFIFSTLGRLQVWFWIKVFMAIAVAAVMTLRPLVLKRLLNTLSEINPAAVFMYTSGLATLYVGMGFLIPVFFRISDYAWLHLNPGLKRKLGDLLMAKTMRHSPLFLQEHFSGALAGRIKDAMSGIPDLLNLSSQHLLSNALALTFSIILFWTLDVRFAAALTAWTLVFLSGSLLASKKVGRLSEAAAQARSTVVGTFVDILSNLTHVRLFSAQDLESKRLRGQLKTYAAADQARDRYLIKIFAFQGFSFSIYQCFCMFWLLQGFKQGSLSVGDFALIFAINISLIDRLWMLSENISKFAELRGTILQGLEVALAPPQLQDAPDAQPLEVLQGRITFERVRFRYPTSELIFDEQSIDIQAGQKVGLVGYSGSGKSTFVNLILRLFDVESGQILIDGQSVASVTQESLRQAIGMIPQEPMLFHRSLRDNIRYGRPEASDADIQKAAQQAYADAFIERLPQGYASLVGERGVKLSGGQRQRIAIARVFLKNPPILILDEATSQLDSVTESQIQASLLRLMEGKTTLVVAHRLSTLLHMDRILVFESGNIVQDGCHRGLLAQEGLYKTLWDAQVGGFLPEAPKKN